jgi:hypothetical protein
MITATYFGEIAELGSRAVWYSDEESDADDDADEIESKPLSRLRPAIGSTSHEVVRANISAYFKRLRPNPSAKITSCLISLSSSPQYKNLKINDPNLTLIGTIGNLGKVVVCPPVDAPNGNANSGECSLWLIFDSSDPTINGQEVAYFVEVLREQLYSELNVEPNSSIIILSQQFSRTEHLEYLTNFHGPLIRLPFSGRSILPPVLIKNQLESALFEQLTLTHKLAYVVCLPDPKNYWFDKAECWPAVANQVIEHKLNDDNLEKTLIFT